MIVSGAFLGIVNTVLTEAVMAAAVVERPIASSAYSFVRFTGGAIAPFLAGKLAEHVSPERRCSSAPRWCSPPWPCCWSSAACWPPSGRPSATRRRGAHGGRSRRSSSSAEALRSANVNRTGEVLVVRMARRIAWLAALVAVGVVAQTARAQDPPPEPLPPGIPAYHWQQLITWPTTVWACRKHIKRHGNWKWRFNLVARSKETQWQVSASARLQRWPRKKTLDDWSSGVLDPGEVSKVGHVAGDVDRNDQVTVGAGHRNGPYKGMGLGGTTKVRDLNRC